jgi:hypothetical protein
MKPKQKKKKATLDTAQISHTAENLPRGMVSKTSN